MAKTQDLVGRKFGRLKVLEFEAAYVNGWYWRCICDCGNITFTSTHKLTSGHTSSCGCLRRETNGQQTLKHGHARKNRHTKIYERWKGMHARCYNPSHESYKRYGGRGIAVCTRWFNFENFLKDMGLPPAGLTIERKNNDGDYCPSNCKWATQKEQQNNRSNNLWRKQQ